MTITEKNSAFGRLVGDDAEDTVLHRVNRYEIAVAMLLGLDGSSIYDTALDRVGGELFRKDDRSLGSMPESELWKCTIPSLHGYDR